MPTIKLKYFEHAGHDRKRQTDASSPHVFSALDTPNGFAFIVAGSNTEVQGPHDMAHIVVERMNYYLSNEVLDDAGEAVRNALIYANGFVHVMAGKDPEIQLADLSCLCVLIKDNTAHYAWLGQVCLYLFTGRKLVALTWDLSQEDDLKESPQSLKAPFLGQQQIISPGICSKPFCPVDGDILLMASSGFCNQPDEDYIKRVLEDSMPSHAKAARLLSRITDDNLPAACQLIRFYNTSNEVRSFVPGEQIQAPKSTPSTISISGRVVPKSTVQIVLASLFLLLLSYMVYDLFLFDPIPATRIQLESIIAQETAAVSDISSSELSDVAIQDNAEPSSSASDNIQAEEQSPANAQTPGTIPQDVIYTVKSGDNWGRIYREFEVCSWFIRNHPPNKGKFNSANNPVSGSQIHIPLLYSAKSDLNPAYFQEFSIEKVGRSCQNANARLRKDFEQRMLGNSQ